MAKKAHPSEIAAFRAGITDPPGARCPYIATSDCWEFYQLGAFHKAKGITAAAPTRTRAKGGARFTDLDGRRFAVDDAGSVTMTNA